MRLDDLVLVEEEVYAYRLNEKVYAYRLNEIATHAQELRSTTAKPTQTRRGTEGAKPISAGPLLQKESSLTLSFSRDELDRYVIYRKSRLAEKSKDWIDRSSKLLWDCTKGEISHQTLETLRERTLKEYTSTDSHSKVLSFAKALLKFLATTRTEPRYQSFAPYLELANLRKFAEQHGDAIEWDQSNRAYILTHGVSGVSWSYYRNPLPENVYDTYMKYWGDVSFGI